MLKTFSLGGVHPDENKLSAGKPIEKLPLPETVYIPLSQHLGAPAKPIVSKNDKVKTGQLIAESAGFISANIHASVAGTVISVDQYADTSGYRKPAIAIKTESDEWIEGVDLSDRFISECSLSSSEIITKINQAGIVGLGGATFPSHVKLSVPAGKKVDVLIINGVECEPYLTADHRLMLEKGQELVAGIRILMKALQVNRAIIGIENNKPDAISHMRELVSQYNEIEVFALKVKYPQGGEKQLIKAAIGREVPSGKLPFDVGVVVHNVGTVYAVYEAVQKNKPLVERVVTVTGKNLPNPSNFLVRIGTPVQKLIDAAGGLQEDTGKIINGGPMMGKAVATPEIPVTKGTSGILLMKENDSLRVKERNCIRCGKCITVCPMGLEPYLLAQLTEREEIENVWLHHALDCMECGCCHYTCPSGRPLLDYIRLGKSKVTLMLKKRSNK